MYILVDILQIAHSNEFKKSLQTSWYIFLAIALRWTDEYFIISRTMEKKMSYKLGMIPQRILSDSYNALARWWPVVAFEWLLSPRLPLKNVFDSFRQCRLRSLAPLPLPSAKRRCAVRPSITCMEHRQSSHTHALPAHCRLQSTKSFRCFSLDCQVLLPVKDFDVLLH